VPDRVLLNALADMVNLARATGPTLVHCQAGLNRSGLVTALALIRGGMQPEQAIAKIRQQRCAMPCCATAHSTDG
jgi:protein-tyrosine phosphatase